MFLPCGGRGSNKAAFNIRLSSRIFSSPTSGFSPPPSCAQNICHPKCCLLSSTNKTFFGGVLDFRDSFCLPVRNIGSVVMPETALLTEWHPRAGVERHCGRIWPQIYSSKLTNWIHRSIAGGGQQDCKSLEVWGCKLLNWCWTWLRFDVISKSGYCQISFI